MNFWDALNKLLSLFDGKGGLPCLNCASIVKATCPCQVYVNWLNTKDLDQTKETKSMQTKEAT